MINPKICFTIYRDFTKYFDEEDYENCDAALEVLNKMLEESVKKNKLTFLYKNRKVKIVLPLTYRNVGNIFGKEDGIPHWSDVDIPCEIDCNECDFDDHKLRVNLYPDWMDPKYVCW